MPRIRRVALVACLGLGLLSGQIWAVPFTVTPDQPNLNLGLLQNTWRGSQELQEVSDLLKKGERKQAKLKLANFLTRFPRDARGPEMAGLIFLEEKNLGMAELSFRNALTLNPQQATARSKLGVTLLMQNNPKEAETELNKTLEVRPADSVARRYLGWLEETRGNLPGALTHYEYLLKSGELAPNTLTEVHATLGKIYNLLQRYSATVDLLTPLLDHPESETVNSGARMVLATAHIGLGDKAAAKSQLQLLQKLLPADHPELRLIQAGVARLEGDFATARTRLQAVKKDTPAYAGVAGYQLTRVSLAEGNWQQAVKELEGIAPLVEKTDLAQVLGELTNLYMAHHQVEKAVPSLTEYVKKFPDLPDLQYLLAEAKVEAHDTEGAITVLQQLKSSHTHYAPAYHLSAMIATLQNKPADTEKDLRKAIELEPGFIDAWVALAGLHLAQKDYDKAKITLDRALQTIPGHPMLLFQRGVTYDMTGKSDEANKVYRSILNKYPDHVPTLNKLALNLADNNNLQEAKQLAERAYKLAEREPTAKDSYGWILLRSGDTKTALPLLEEAIKDMPTDGVANYHLGAAYLKIGKTAQGRQLLSKALSLGVTKNTEGEINNLLK